MFSGIWFFGWVCYYLGKMVLNTFLESPFRKISQSLHFKVFKLFVEHWKPAVFRSSHPGVFLVKGVLKIYNKFTGEHPRRSAISIKLLCNFIEITLQHGCSPVNLLYICRTTFTKNTSGWLLLNFTNNNFTEESLFKTPLSVCFCLKCYSWLSPHSQLIIRRFYRGVL